MEDDIPFQLGLFFSSACFFSGVVDQIPRGKMCEDAVEFYTSVGSYSGFCFKSAVRLLMVQKSGVHQRRLIVYLIVY